MSPLISKPTENELVIDELKVVGGDYVQTAAAGEISRQKMVDRAIEETLDVARDRKVFLTFASGVENTEELAAKFTKAGLRSTCVHSKMKNEYRDLRIQGYKEGHYQNLVVNNIGTVGFDHPPIDCIIDLRPTTSVVFHIQKYGRGTRPFFHPTWSWDQLKLRENRLAAIQQTGKLNCLVLDFATNAKRLGPINDPQIPKPPKARTCPECGAKCGSKKTCPECGADCTRDTPFKLCPKCGAYNHVSAKTCEDVACGYKFPVRVKITGSAGSDILIRKNSPEIKTLDVTRSFAAIHKKAGQPDFLVVNYFCGSNHFRAYLNFGGKGIPRMKAVRWWRQHHNSDAPDCSHKALALFSECREAKRLQVDTGKKWPDIMGYLF